MKTGNRATLYGKLALAGCALMAMAFVLPATPIAPADDADACRGFRHHRRYRSSVTKKKVKDRWELKINYYNKYYKFNGGSYRLKTVNLYTKSKKVADFIHKKGTSLAFWKAVAASASRFTCKDLLIGKRLVKLEHSLGTAVAKHYRKKTKKSAGKLDVMLGMYAPYRAYCKPTKKQLAVRP